MKRRDDEDTPARKILVHDFLVDFLGGLVPGSLFWVGTCAALLPPLYLIFCFSEKCNVIPFPDYMSKILSSTRDTPNVIWLLVFALFVAISYEIGHLFFRKDPKNPDTKSFEKLKKKAEKRFDSPDKTKKYLKTEYACTSAEECQFPYYYLKDYIGKRGHCHLCSFVLWKDDKASFERSKTFINLLKIRLKHYYPQQCSVIIRNEAHVRLASSSWYVSNALSFCSITGIVLALTAILIKTGSNFFLPTNSIYFPFLVPPVIVLVASKYIRTRIEDFIHYQRLREVFYVLETAFVAFRENRDLLIPPFSDFSYKFSAEECKRKECDYHPEKRYNNSDKKAA